METEKLLKQMEACAFGTAYQEALSRMYQNEVEAGLMEIPEQEYASAMATLPRELSDEKQAMLATFTEISKEIQTFYAQYGFIAGLYCGFLQYFTEDEAEDGGFQKYVFENVGRMPNMRRHHDNYARIKQCNRLGQALELGEEACVKEHIVSVACTWSQRAYSVSIHGFYCGYRAALDVADRVAPSDAVHQDRLTVMEYTLGLR